MSRILLTGFKPFLSNKRNPSELVARGLSLFYDVEILDVAYDEVRAYMDALDGEKYDFVICLGLNAKADCPRLEQFAYNETSTVALDNKGIIPEERKILDGPDKLETSLPIEHLCNALKDKRFDVELSDDPGRYLCNFIYYLALEKKRGSALFIHLPPVSLKWPLVKLIAFVSDAVSLIVSGTLL